jgi:hypothetical protein
VAVTVIITKSTVFQVYNVMEESLMFGAHNFLSTLKEVTRDMSHQNVGLSSN